MAVVTLMVMTVAVVTSCSDDDKEPEKVPTSAAMDFNFAVDKSLLEVVDVTIQYYKDGVVKTEVMNSEHWDDTLTKTSSKMPNTLGLKITMALKDGVTLDKEAYNSLRYMDLFQTTNIRFDMTNTHRLTEHRIYQNETLIELYIKNEKI